MSSNFDMLCIIYVSWTKIHAGINFYFMNIQVKPAPALIVLLF